MCCVCVTVIGAERVFVKEIGDFDCSKRKIFLASRGGASRPARPGAAEEVFTQESFLIHLLVARPLESYSSLAVLTVPVV